MKSNKYVAMFHNIYGDIMKDKKKKDPYKEEYGYDFVAELAHFTNIDEQRKKAKELEELSDKSEKD